MRRRSGPDVTMASPPAIEDFQPEQKLAAGEAIQVEPGRGWLLRLG
ncbi:hypothetical protein [Streptomyces sp. NPDC055099]